MRFIFIFLTSLFVMSPGLIFSQTPDVDFAEKSETEDMDALRRWLKDKRLVSVKEIGGDLSLSGEVRTEFQMASEKRNGVKQRGHNAATSTPTRVYDVEFNLMLDYRTNRTWASVKLKFDNDMGTQSGTMNKISLDRAYLGGRVIAGDTFTWDIELGRRFLFSIGSG